MIPLRPTGFQDPALTDFRTNWAEIPLGELPGASISILDTLYVGVLENNTPRNKTVALKKQKETNRDALDRPRVVSNFSPGTYVCVL